MMIAVFGKMLGWWLFFVFVLEVPGDEDVLGLEDFVLLLIGPDVDQQATTYSQDSPHLFNSFNAQSRGGEVVDHSD